MHVGGFVYYFEIGARMSAIDEMSTLKSLSLSASNLRSMGDWVSKSSRRVRGFLSTWCQQSNAAHAALRRHRACA